MSGRPCARVYEHKVIATEPLSYSQKLAARGNGFGQAGAISMSTKEATQMSSILFFVPRSRLFDQGRFLQR